VVNHGRHNTNHKRCNRVNRNTYHGIRYPLSQGQNLRAKAETHKEYIDTAVQAAEKLFPTVDGEKLGKEKLNYVAECLKDKGVSFDVDDVYDDVRIMIEAAVNEFCG
jgi:hypothetical protein